MSLSVKPPGGCGRVSWTGRREYLHLPHQRPRIKRAGEAWGFLSSQVGEEEEEEAPKGAMAALLLWAPLLLLGTVAGQAQTEVDGCLWLWNVTEGNFSVEATPDTYQANTTYLGKAAPPGSPGSRGSPSLPPLLSDVLTPGEL